MLGSFLDGQFESGMLQMPALSTVRARNGKNGSSSKITEWIVNNKYRIMLDNWDKNSGIMRKLVLPPINSVVKSVVPSLFKIDLEPFDPVMARLVWGLRFR